MRKTLLITGKLAALILRSAAEEALKLFNISFNINIPSILAAAFTTARDILEHLSRDPVRARCYKRSMYVRDLSRVVEALGIDSISSREGEVGVSEELDC